MTFKEQLMLATLNSVRDLQRPIGLGEQFIWSTEQQTALVRTAELIAEKIGHGCMVSKVFPQVDPFTHRSSWFVSATSPFEIRTKLAVGYLPRMEGSAKHEVIPSPLICYPLRLHPGEEIKTTLAKFTDDNGLHAAFILSAVGSVTKATLRYANSTTMVTLQGPFEIVSLVGTLSAGGHLHVTLSDGEGKTVGGHVIGDMEVYTTAEVMIGECTDVTFRRDPDEQTGYDELVISKITETKK